MKKRIEWIDIAKCLGIFAIYLGHFGDACGLAYDFVFAFHVPLFFFLSGCMSNYDYETNIVKFTIKKIKRLLIPFYVFALIAIIVVVINNNEYIDITKYLIVVAKGCIREQFFAASLWFLSCLFVMEIVFKIIKLLKNKLLILFISLIMYVISVLIISPIPIIEPHWIYNIDSMMFYIIFYALGYLLYPYIFNLFKLDSRRKKVNFCFLLIVSGIYASLLFVGISVLRKISTNYYINGLWQILQPIILIMFILCISKLLEGISIFSRIGKETLYLCGNEFLVRQCVPALLYVVGLSPSTGNPLVSYMYTIILIMFNIEVIIPIEKAIKKNILSLQMF